MMANVLPGGASSYPNLPVFQWKDAFDYRGAKIWISDVFLDVYSMPAYSVAKLSFRSQIYSFQKPTTISGALELYREVHAFIDFLADTPI
jgi:hypothetical protein